MYTSCPKHLRYSTDYATQFHLPLPKNGKRQKPAEKISSPRESAPENEILRNAGNQTRLLLVRRLCFERQHNWSRLRISPSKPASLSRLFSCIHLHEYIFICPRGCDKCENLVRILSISYTGNHWVTQYHILRFKISSVESYRSTRQVTELRRLFSSDKAV